MAASVDNSCAVCLAETQNPRKVPCGNDHVFCLSCLEGLVAHGKTVQDNAFPCPCCRKRVTIPRGGVAFFPTVGEAGSSPPPESSSRAPRPGHAPIPRNRRRYPPGFPPMPFADRPDYAYPGPRPPPMAPFPGLPPRDRYDRMFPRRRPRADLQTDGAESPRQDSDRPPYTPPDRRQGPPPFPRRPFEQGGGQQFPYRRPPRGPRAGFEGYPDDLDMDEVMLVIAQMEEEEEQRAKQEEMVRLQSQQEEEMRLQSEHEEEMVRVQSEQQEMLRLQSEQEEEMVRLQTEQEEMLRMQTELNEQEDQLEALGVVQDGAHL